MPHETDAATMLDLKNRGSRECVNAGATGLAPDIASAHLGADLLLDVQSPVCTIIPRLRL
jgi:hypothetical protein